MACASAPLPHPSPSCSLAQIPAETAALSRSARAQVPQEPSLHLLLSQDSLDALALVGTEADAGFAGASPLLHLFLLVFLLHFHLGVEEKREAPVSADPAATVKACEVQTAVLYCS